MKYVADDGAVFTSEQECTRYEQDLERDKGLQAEAAKFLDMQDWPEDEKSKKRERSKAERWIHAWLAYDARQRPYRYRAEDATYENPGPERDPNDLPLPAEIAALNK